MKIETGMEFRYFDNYGGDNHYFTDKIYKFSKITDNMVEVKWKSNVRGYEYVNYTYEQAIRNINDGVWVIDYKKYRRNKLKMINNNVKQ